MGKTIRYGERKKIDKQTKKSRKSISPRTFYNKLDGKNLKIQKLSQKRRTTYK